MNTQLKISKSPRLATIEGMAVATMVASTAEMKIAAKPATKTHVRRDGDMLAAGVVFLGTHLLSFGVTSFALANIGFVLMAIGVAVLLLREYKRITAPAEEPPLAVPIAQPQEA